MVSLRHSPQLDIQLDSPYKDLVLIRGSSYESPSLELKGSVQIKVPDAFNAKRLTLKLIGTHKLDFHHMHSTQDGPVMHAVREETKVLECVWDNLLVTPEGCITKQYHGQDAPFDFEDHPHSGSNSPSVNPSPSASYTNLFHLGSSSSSQSSTSGSGTPHSNTHHIPAGTHHQLFQIVLPGDIPETIDGLGSGSVVYRLQATLEKASSSFKSCITKHKYIKIIRTMSHDALSMSETMFIGSTWPGKVQYEFSIPSKALAIGSTTPVHILLVPLMKGITLGPIKAQLIQSYLLTSPKDKTQTFQESHVVVESRMDQHQGTELMDTTRIDSELKIPDYLKLCLPNCDLPGEIVKVRHKIKLSIALKNPDGHTSELRSNLPVNMFISPHHPVKARKTELDKNGKVYFLRDSDLLFAETGSGNVSGSSSAPTNSNASPYGEQDEPLPSYEHHFYDQRFTPIGTPMASSPMASNPGSGLATPIPRPQLLTQADDYFSISESHSPTRVASPMHIPHDHTLHLREQLQKLSVERMSQVPTYDEAIHSDTPNSPDLEFAPDYNTVDNYYLGEPQGLSISPARRRYTDSNSSPTQPPAAHPHDTLQHHDYTHYPLQSSPLRSASTTNLVHAHNQAMGNQVHAHSPLAGSKNGSMSMSNLSKMVGIKLLSKDRGG